MSYLNFQYLIQIIVNGNIVFLWFKLQTVLLKKFTGSEGEKGDVQKFFGYIGLFTLLGLWWLGEYWIHNQ